MFLRCRIFMLAVRVSLCQSGEKARAPRLGNLGRASPATWASLIHPLAAPIAVGRALRFSRQPRYRMGFRRTPRQHRDQLSGMFIESIDPLWVGAGFTANLLLDRPVKIVCL